MAKQLVSLSSSIITPRYCPDQVNCSSWLLREFGWKIYSCCLRIGPWELAELFCRTLLDMQKQSAQRELIGLSCNRIQTHGGSTKKHAVQRNWTSTLAHESKVPT